MEIETEVKKEASGKFPLDRALDIHPGLDIHQVLRQQKESPAAEQFVAPKTRREYPPFEAVNTDELRHEFSQMKNTSSPEQKKKSDRKRVFAQRAESIRERIGGPESIRRQLGLSKKAFADLLMVDPSAMNRWCKGEAEAPAYIYQALDWYLMLSKKHPFLSDPYFLRKDSAQAKDEAREQKKIKALVEQSLRELSPAPRKRAWYVWLGLFLAGFLLGLVSMLFAISILAKLA